MKRFPLLLVIAIGALVSACGTREAEAPPAPAAPAATSTPATPVAPATVTDEQLKAAATAAQETSAQETADEETDPGDASLERIAALPESAQLPAGRWKAGQHYRPIVPAQTTSAEPGQVEVLEVFWLGCPHCYQIDPFMRRWEQGKAPYVKFASEHIMWGPSHRAHARLYYTLQALGKDEALVPKAFEEIHRHGNILVAADDAQSQRLQLAFAKANGISEADFNREYNGFAVNTRLQRAEEIMRRYKVESVPFFVINGKYQTDISMAGGVEQLLQLINDMSAAEKGR